MRIWHFKLRNIRCLSGALPHTEVALLNFSYELLIIFGLSCRIQSTPCEHWTTVEKKSFSLTANERRRN